MNHLSYHESKEKNNNHNRLYFVSIIVKIMKRSKSKTPSAEKRPVSGPRVDWVPPHPALGAQVIQNKIEENTFFLLYSYWHH